MGLFFLSHVWSRVVARDEEDKVPKLKVSSAYPGEWYIVEIDGGDGALSIELHRPVGSDEADVFHLRFATAGRPFTVESEKGGTAHTHREVDRAHLTFSGPSDVWPDFVRCIQALASVFDTFSTDALDREKVREHFFRRRK
jgi:hypothetical protein